VEHLRDPSKARRLGYGVLRQHSRIAARLDRLIEETNRRRLLHRQNQTLTGWQPRWALSASVCAPRSGEGATDHAVSIPPGHAASSGPLARSRKTALPSPFVAWHTLSCGATRAAELQLWSPPVSGSRHPAQLLGLLALREDRGCPADAQARSGPPVRSRQTTSRRPTTGRTSSWTSGEPATSRSGPTLGSEAQPAVRHRSRPAVGERPRRLHELPLSSSPILESTSAGFSAARGAENAMVG